MTKDCPAEAWSSRIAEYFFGPGARNGPRGRPLWCLVLGAPVTLCGCLTVSVSASRAGAPAHVGPASRRETETETPGETVTARQGASEGRRGPAAGRAARVKQAERLGRVGADRRLPHRTGTARSPSDAGRRKQASFIKSLAPYVDPDSWPDLSCRAVNGSRVLMRTPTRVPIRARVSAPIRTDLRHLHPFRWSLKNFGRLVSVEARFRRLGGVGRIAGGSPSAPCSTLVARIQHDARRDVTFAVIGWHQY